MTGGLRDDVDAAQPPPVRDSSRDRVRAFWDLDAPTYDRIPSHHPNAHVERAAWRFTLRDLLPEPPARVLDVGAGTGVLSLLLAECGYDVTALDLSPGMLARLRAKAAQAGHDVRAVEGDAAAPPTDGFDAVVERHVLWTLPHPDRALAAWRAAAPTGRLVLVESLWGAAANAAEVARGRARAAIARLRGQPPGHHAEYDDDLRDSLPLGRGTPVDQLLTLVAASPWGEPRLHRLVDVEWAVRTAMPLPERLIGVAPRYAVVAGR